ncbi:PadR family transcriptional regulator [Aquipuribacter sp. SD81]|uniref:PadR family transcriptional regulator n=1 Tax=Aquipuribacter sp. SD81 TaxID=3127703 RepID=UPI00301A900C
MTPLGDVPYLVLAALAGGRRHGYDVVRVVSTLTDGRVALGAGTLYGALDRLSTQGLVADDGEERVGGRLRRYYRLTDDGTALLEAETARREDVTAAVRRRLVAAPGAVGGQA